MVAISLPDAVGLKVSCSLKIVNFQFFVTLPNDATSPSFCCSFTAHLIIMHCLFSASFFFNDKLPTITKQMFAHSRPTLLFYLCIARKTMNHLNHINISIEKRHVSKNICMQLKPINFLLITRKIDLQI